MLLNSAFATLLSRYSGETDIVVGTPIANRDQAGLQDLVGFFVNNLAVRTDLADDPTFIQLMERRKLNC